MHQSVTDPARLVLVERWETPEALKRHFETPHFKAWRAAGPDFVAERKVEVVTPKKSIGREPLSAGKKCNA